MRIRIKSILRRFAPGNAFRASRAKDVPGNCDRIGGVIDDYINGHLSGKETDTLEEHFLECDKCSKTLEERIILWEVLHAEGENLFDGLVEEAEALHRKVGEKRDWSALPGLFDWMLAPQRKWGLALAATCLILLIPALLLYNMQQDPRRLATVEPYPYIAPVVRGTIESAAGMDDFRIGMDFYLIHDYDSAIPYLEEAAAADPSNPEMLFFLGVSLLLDDRCEEAIRHLVRVNGERTEWDANYWFLANAYLMDGNIESAVESLERVIALEGKYYREAVNLNGKVRERAEIPRE